jgi:hypothetical protein
LANISRQNADPKPYPVCGAINQSGYPCGNQAGKATDHPGIGRCKFHGGTTQTVSSIIKKQGLGTAISFPGIEEEFEHLKQSRDVFDLRDHIFLIEAIAKTVLNSAKTVDDLPLVVKMVSDATKAIQKLDEIEHGRRLVIELPELRYLFDQIKVIIFRHVQDTYTRSLIGADLSLLSSGRASDTDQSSDGNTTVDSGLAVESGPGRGEKEQI